jgi:hypothetical protein
MLSSRVLLIITVGLASRNLATAQELEVDVRAVRRLVSEWNEAHTLSTVGKLSSLYSDTVDFYGSILRRRTCIGMKRTMLEKQKDFVQVLTNELVLSGYDNGAVRCDFVKKVSHNNRTVDYRSYLIVRRIDGNYLIVGESDLITDRNIKHELDLGTGVKIKEVQFPEKSNRNLATILILSVSLVCGLIGFIFLFRNRKKTNISKTPVPIAASDLSTNVAVNKEYEKGLAFENYIVEQFARDKNFTLQEWRSDKFHQGIFPQSNRDPDLVYQYVYKDFVRTFSVECKYRSSSLFNSTVRLMREDKYRIYEAFHRTKMPVYIALGVGGKPNRPKEVYLIPFDHVKPVMTMEELFKYWQRRPFFYDMDKDRLTWR